jgi:hypothetical protein
MLPTLNVSFGLLFMMLYATFNNISVYILTVSFINGENTLS